eukprot:1479983-Amphidinium_carterae.2
MQKRSDNPNSEQAAWSIASSWNFGTPQNPTQALSSTEHLDQDVTQKVIRLGVGAEREAVSDRKLEISAMQRLRQEGINVPFNANKTAAIVLKKIQHTL